MGLYTGISPILSAAIFSVLSAFGVEWLSKRKDMREDSAIAVFWTLGMALGIIFTFLSPGFAPDLSAYLFGNILTITFGDIALLGGLAILLILFFSCFLHPIIYVAFDREFARSQGIPVQAFELYIDDVHRIDYRSLPPYGGYRAGYLITDNSANDSQSLLAQVSPYYMAIHRHRLS